MTSERKVVVITGASPGIGAQLSKAYRHIGYQVIATPVFRPSTSTECPRVGDNP
jgi:NAD(P)-dependent dehydrogenase (short-subunit alcohol dehydrogenase family)